MDPIPTAALLMVDWQVLWRSHRSSNAMCCPVLGGPSQQTHMHYVFISASQASTCC